MQTRLPWMHGRTISGCLRFVGLEREAQEICTRHGVTLDERLRDSRRRYGRVSAARHDIARMLYVERPHLSLPNIGAMLNIDHTSVLYAAKKLSRRGTELATHTGARCA